MALSKLSVDSSYKLVGEVEETGEEVGRGAYGVVTVVKYKGMRCAAKKLHPILLQSYDPRGLVLDRFIGECMLHFQLHHPHIVQSLGCYQQEIAPVLVMELLSTDLCRCIDRFGVLPNEISFSILHHVALGLQYLHERSEPIIHRNLSANNILLTDDMTAKIGDFGSAVVLTPSVVNRPMTPTPGNLSYMPPEAFPHDAKYDTKLDIFSYGVLMVHTLSGQFPVDLGRQELSEADRRQKYLEAIGSEHPLMGLILRCLRNDPTDRPTAREIVSSALNPGDELDALCNFHRQGKSQRKQEDCAQSFETILSRAVESIPASEISTYVGSVAVPESISEDQPALEVIRGHTSYLNYHLVEDMVEKFGDDKLKADMKEFRTNLKKFRRQTTVSDFLVISRGKRAAILEPPRENYAELSVKLDEEGEDTTMEDVERIRKYIAHKLSLPLPTISFYTVEEGSVEVKFLVDRRRVGQALAMKCEGLVELKFQENVLEIRVDGSILNMNQQEGDLSLETEVERQQQHEADGQLRLREENVVLRRNISTLGEENSILRRNISSLREENIALQQEITYSKRSKPGWWEGLGTRLITGFKSRVNVGMASEVESSSIDDSLLSHGDQDEIMSFLYSLSDKNIYDLGIALGISHQRLTDASKGASFLGNMILDWLNSVDKVGKPSWRSLVIALKDPMVKQTGIANNIAAKKHRT